MSEERLDFLGRNTLVFPDSAEIRLIAEQPRQSHVPDGYRQVIKAAESGQAFNVKLKAHRRAKLRTRDLHDLSDLHVGVNDLAVEIDAITHADDLFREHCGHSSEANAVDQQRHARLKIIREKLVKLKLVMDSVDGNPIIDQQYYATIGRASG